MLQSQVLAAVLSHYWFRNNEPTITTAAISLLILPLCSPLLEVTLLTNTPRLYAIALGYLLYYLTLSTSIILYRISPFHPLAKHPGPLLCKISKWTGVWVAIKGNSHQFVKDLHLKYGPVVRVGPNELSIVDKDVIPPILGKNGMPRGPLWDGRRFHQANSLNEKGYDSIIDVRDNKIHHQLRKDWNIAFNSTALKDYQELVEARGKQLRDHLHAASVQSKKGNANEPVDFSEWVTHFSFDVMGDLAFGGCFELMRDGDAQGFRRGMEEGILLPCIMQHIPWINPLLTSIPFISAKMQVFSAFGVLESEKRMAAHTKREDLFYHLVLPGEKTDRSDAEQLELIVSNSLLTIVAGSDTTATALTAIFCFLLSSPRVYRTLRAELEQAFPNVCAVDGWPEIEGDTLVTLPYLNAAINEIMRLVPAVPTHLQRAPEPGSGGKLLGETKIFIPEGTAVCIPPFALHRDPRYFSPDPDAFIPERWLDGGEDVIYTTNRDAFIPFSYGPANCAGKALAMAELRYTVATLARCFDMHHYGCKNAGPKELQAKASEWTASLKDRFVFEKGTKLLVEIASRK
ncbi:cytochrome P450, partial [Ephemerocybe angulata]